MRIGCKSHLGTWFLFHHLLDYGIILRQYYFIVMSQCWPILLIGYTMKNTEDIKTITTYFQKEGMFCEIW